MNTPHIFDASLTLIQQKSLTLSLVGALAFPGSLLELALSKLGLYSTPTITSVQCLPPKSAGPLSACGKQAR